MIRAVIYARYSSSNQSEQSIEGQIRECTEYAKSKGLTIVGKYIDRAISGRTDNRPDFQRMMSDCSKNMFDAVIVYRTDRFARNKYDSAIYKRELKRANITLHYAAETIPDGPEGIILESLMEGLAEYYSAELSQKIKRGMRENALKALCTGGNIALGYKIGEDKTFQINETEAPTVRMIFEMFNKGINNANICKHLNKLGLRTSRGNLFSNGSITRIIKNDKYIGVYRCGDVCVENAVPAIISRTDFFMAQKELEKRRTSKQMHLPRSEYLLSGKMFCGHCKKKMIGVSGTGKSGNKFYYYCCPASRAKKECIKKQVSRDWIENLIVEETIKHILRPEVISYLSNKLYEIQLSDKAQDERLMFYEQKLSEGKKAINNTLKAIESGVETKSLPARLRELEIEQTHLEIEYKQAQEMFVTLTPEQIEFLLKKQAVVGKDDQDYKRQIINGFVSEVYLYDSKLLIYYNIDKNLSELSQSELEEIEDAEDQVFDQQRKASTKNK